MIFNLRFTNGPWLINVFFPQACGGQYRSVISSTTALCGPTLSRSLRLLLQQPLWLCLWWLKVRLYKRRTQAVSLTICSQPGPIQCCNSKTHVCSRPVANSPRLEPCGTFTARFNKRTYEQPARRCLGKLPEQSPGRHTSKTTGSHLCRQPVCRSPGSDLDQRPDRSASSYPFWKPH